MYEKFLLIVPRTLFAVFIFSLKCWSKRSLSSMVTPRSWCYYQYSRGCNQRLVSVSFWSRFSWACTYQGGAYLRSDSSVQLTIWLMSIWRCWQSSTVCICLKSFVSSINKYTEEPCWSRFSKQLMYGTNNKGPSTKPLGYATQHTFLVR